MTGDELRAYRNLCEKLRADLRPQGELEERLVRSLANAQYRLDRAYTIEQNMFFELTAKQVRDLPQSSDDEAAVSWAQAQAKVFLNDGKQFDLIARYATRFHRQILQLKAALDTSQRTRRKLEAAGQLQPPRIGPSMQSPAATPTNQSVIPLAEFVSQEELDGILEDAAPSRQFVKKEAA